MLTQPVTLADRIGGIGKSACAAIFVFVLAKIVHYLIAAKNRRKWIHGEPICWWASGMCFLGSSYGVITATNGFLMYKSAGIMGAMGAAIGIFIGLLHGARRIDKSFPLNPQPKPKQEEKEEMV